MTRQEYNKKIDAVIHRLSADNAETSGKTLDELFEYKPVPLKWYIAKAKVMLLSGEAPEQIMEFLESRGWYGYNYPGLEELSELYVKLCELKGDELDARRNKLAPWICFGEPYQKYADEIEAEYELLRQREIDFCEDTDSNEKALALMESYFVTGNTVCFCLVSYLLKKRNVSFEYRKSFLERSNYGWLEERVLSDDEETFIIAVTDEKDALDCDTASVILTLLGKKVIMLDIPVDCPTEERINISDTLPISLENTTENNGVTLISPISVRYGSKEIDNRAELIEHIIKNYTRNDFAVTLCSGALLDDLRERPLLRKRIHRLDSLITPGQEKYLSFARTGSYVEFISKLFEFDVRAALDSEAECDYSIVVPARNSARTLRYTLMTCLDQRYNGSYEIVLSDNSAAGNTEVYELYREMNDPKIKYYKTPCELTLARSFEYAYLHARGKFILSLGSDDAILPWGLEKIDEFRKDFPDKEIFSWIRGFYAWPGFNGGQQNQLQIPIHKRDDRSCSELDLLQMLKRITRDREILYFLPTMYINSGFKRGYLKTLLERTGCILDGSCQDIYTGTINACIFKKLMLIHFPITVAGMSSNSVNSALNITRPVNHYGGSITVTPRSVYKKGDYSFTPSERTVPAFGSDLQTVYVSLFRAKTYGLISKAEIENIISTGELLKQMINDIRTDDDYFDNKIHYVLYTVSKSSKNLYNNIKNNIENIAPTKIEFSESELTKKLYSEGFDDRELVLDASKFGVTNIYEAVELFDKILNL